MTLDDLSVPQYRALEAVIAPHEEWVDGPIVTWRGDSDWTSGIVNGKAASSLERLGLVRTRANPDYAGNRIVEATPAGLALWAEGDE